ncbi:hypothetical protein EXU85_14030 [Spirosoma sp. KCTC 42546]|uniref:DUF6563 family protein n=1 Tax=Spirosoma sp. KCTC 42546 TaxID=2520506 RepID=UPI0011578356|nr:DUF6563 family protein [Spirosoma sp. KCTC 42546]QDK79663.1 hypothetical protein EXU85_14030 [Spirosoma sp. KCTC 42546]
MKVFFTLLIVLLTISGLALAQKPEIIRLLFRPDLTMSPQGRLFAIDSVIDARLDTLSHIGAWQYASGKTAEIHLKDGFKPSLTNFAVNSLPNIDKKLPSYALTIHEFTINGTPLTTRFDLAVTFSKHIEIAQPKNNSNAVKNSRQIERVFKADVIVENSSKTITEVLKQGIAIAFLKFNDFLANPNVVPAIYNDLALESAKAAQDLNLLWATYDSTRSDEDNLLRCSQLRPGIYQSFSELRQNRPSLIGTLVVEEKKGFADLRKPSGSWSRTNFFGFCNGKDLFINTRSYQHFGITRRYVKVKSIGRYLLWIDNYLTSGEITGASFGLVGALATSSYTDCMVLDMKTGGVFRVTKDKLPEMLAGHDDLLVEFETLPNPRDGLQHFRLLDRLNQLDKPVVTR